MIADFTAMQFIFFLNLCVVEYRMLHIPGIVNFTYIPLDCMFPCLCSRF